MPANNLLDRYMEPLLSGKRHACRELVLSALDAGVEPRKLYNELIWPSLQRVDMLYRHDRINIAEEHLATRITRTVADHLQAHLPRAPRHGRKIVITSAVGEQEELSGQMCADLFEAEGWDVYFLGGGIPQDEIGTLIGQLQPHMLMIVGSKPTDVPAVRQMIDYLRDINACPTMNILVSGGVFNRADGLWRELRADFYADTASEALELASTAAPREIEHRIPGAPKKRRRRRRPPLLNEMESDA